MKSPVLSLRENSTYECCGLKGGLPDQLELTRAAYHLGNRHVPLQVAMGWLRYQHDHVLDDMLRQMGLSVRVSMAAFEPEAGAYQQQGDGHNHAHHHDHSS